MWGRMSAPVSLWLDLSKHGGPCMIHSCLIAVRLMSARSLWCFLHLALHGLTVQRTLTLVLGSAFKLPCCDGHARVYSKKEVWLGKPLKRLCKSAAVDLPKPVLARHF